jgi:hypothetical protein
MGMGMGLPITSLIIITDHPITDLPITGLPITDHPITNLPITGLIITGLIITDLPITDLMATIRSQLTPAEEDRGVGGAEEVRDVLWLKLQLTARSTTPW